ncbi:down syndrome cell adhesion molecule [Caerostris extrusa]|uniref:Down syndrome cell adhesion molecule n=1 Tax=Caerostris extrusa TaxID=172846 RepID=A0AAV4WNA2_CAEEX|nr:down syndrome cell adhesion molecule [Caerostris extrusa]
MPFKLYLIRNISKKHQTTSELQIVDSARNDTGKFTCTVVSDIGMDESVIQFLVQGLPDPPSNLTVLNTTSRSVSLFWEVAHNGNSHITGSIVQYQTVSDTHWNGQTSQLIVSGAENSATLRALTPITLYFVRAISENALGQSRPSLVINITTEEEGNPFPFLTCEKKIPQTKKFVVKSHFQRHTRQIGAILRVSSPNQMQPYNDVFADFRTIKFEEKRKKEVFLCNKKREMKIYDSIQNFKKKRHELIKQEQQKNTGKDNKNPLPGLRGRGAVHSTGAQSIKVMWKPPSEESQHGHIKGYYIGYRTSQSPDNYVFKQVEANSAKEQQSTYITGLQPFTKYDIVVKAYNSAGAGPKSGKISGKTLETAPPTSPIVQIEATGASTIAISWKKDIKDKSAIPEYTVHYKSDDGDWKSEQLGSSVDRYTLTGLKCGSRYQLYMTASNSLGTGEPSTPVFARTQGAAPMSPQASVFLQPNTTYVVLHLSSWKEGGCPITHFAVQHRPKYQSQWITATDKLDSPRDVYVLRHLSPDRDYVVMVTAHSEAGLTQGEYVVGHYLHLP